MRVVSAAIQSRTRTVDIVPLPPQLPNASEATVVSATSCFGLTNIEMPFQRDMSSSHQIMSALATVLSLML